MMITPLFYFLEYRTKLIRIIRSFTASGIRAGLSG